MSTRILLADDHEIVRFGLKIVLELCQEFVVVGDVANGRDAVSKADLLKPDIVIMDIAMPELNGIDATRMILKRHPEIRIIIYSMYQTDEYIYQACNAGAFGFVLKKSGYLSVIDAVKSVKKGKKYFCEEIGQTEIILSNRVKQFHSPIESLSSREREILQLVVDGNTSARIAEMLSLSPKSVETYRSRLMVKLGVTNISSLVKFAIQHNLTNS